MTRVWLLSLSPLCQKHPAFCNLLHSPSSGKFKILLNRLNLVHCLEVISVSISEIPRLRVDDNIIINFEKTEARLGFTSSPIKCSFSKFNLSHFLSM